MRTFPYAVAISLSLIACGNSSTPNPITVDAATGPHVDASNNPGTDAAAATTGLGQGCGTGMPACPTTAPTCLTTSSTAPGFCSAVCHAGATVMTDAQGNFGALSTTPADDSKCTAIFTGTAGAPKCDIPVNLTPTPTNPIQKSTTFTFDAYCGINCGTGNTCPTGLTCNTQAMVCEP